MPTSDYYQRNSEKIKARARLYYQKNRERVKARVNDYNRKNALDIKLKRKPENVVRKKVLIKAKQNLNLSPKPKTASTIYITEQNKKRLNRFCENNNIKISHFLNELLDEVLG